MFVGLPISSLSNQPLNTYLSSEICMTDMSQGSRAHYTISDLNSAVNSTITIRIVNNTASSVSNVPLNLITASRTINVDTSANCVKTHFNGTNYKIIENLYFSGITIPTIGTSAQSFQGAVDGDFHYLKNINITNNNEERF